VTLATGPIPPKPAALAKTSRHWRGHASRRPSAFRGGRGEFGCAPGMGLTGVAWSIDCARVFTSSRLSKHKILLEKLLEANSDSNIRFEELCNLTE
jgi:hypothetical protein